MLSGQWQSFCGHKDDACSCALQTTGVEQSLDEMSFARSACAAAQAGDVRKLARILARDPESVHSDGSTGTSGYTPLHYAARAGKTEAVLLLLDHGSCVDAATQQGQATPLHRAAGMGRLESVQLLLSRGADCMRQDADGEAALHKAAARGHSATCSALLEACPAAAALLERRGRTPAQLAQGEAVATFAAAAGLPLKAVSTA